MCLQFYSDPIHMSYHLPSHRDRSQAVLSWVSTPTFPCHPLPPNPHSWILWTKLYFVRPFPPRPPPSPIPPPQSPFHPLPPPSVFSYPVLFTLIRWCYSCCVSRDTLALAVFFLFCIFIFRGWKRKWCWWKTRF